MTKFIVILCTTKNIEEAREIARGLLEGGLIACASIIQPVESWFVWQGAIETVQEVKLFLKTSEENYGSIEQWICANHSYEVPEIIALPVEHGLAAYLNWVEQSVN